MLASRIIQFIRYMIFSVLVLAVVYSCNDAEAKTIKIAVIDTGFDMKSTWESHQEFRPKRFCKILNTADGTEDVRDFDGHGTGIVGTISKSLNAQNVDYCIIVLKIDLFAISYLRALDEVVHIDPDMVVIALSDTPRISGECQKIKTMLDKKIYVVAAAGNQQLNLNQKTVYPAMCDSRVYKVFNILPGGAFAKTSNTYTEPMANAVSEEGEGVLTIAPDNNMALVSGTSQSSAKFAARLAGRLYRRICELDGTSCRHH